MLNADDLAEAEGEALLAYAEAGLDPEHPPAIGPLCKALFGRAPMPKPHLAREAMMGMLGGEVLIYYRSGMTSARQRFCVAHEAGHGRRRQLHERSDALSEAKADLLGACLIAPRPAFLRAVKRLGHSVYDLAHSFKTTHAAALLRLGECVGRPVLLLGPRERQRGEPFIFGDVRKALRGGVPGCHPIKLADCGRWALMAG